MSYLSDVYHKTGNGLRHQGVCDRVIGQVYPVCLNNKRNPQRHQDDESSKRTVKLDNLIK